MSSISPTNFPQINSTKPFPNPHVVVGLYRHPSFLQAPPLDTVAPIHPACKKFSRALTLGGATGGAGVPAHGNGHGLLGDVVEEGQSLLELHAVDGLSGLTGVLEADTQVRAPRAGALCGRNLLSGVTDL